MHREPPILKTHYETMTYHGSPKILRLWTTLCSKFETKASFAFPKYVLLTHRGFSRRQTLGLRLCYHIDHESLTTAPLSKHIRKPVTKRRVGKNRPLQRRPRLTVAPPSLEKGREILSLPSPPLPAMANSSGIIISCVNIKKTY